jgi:hypothetical protein
VQSRRGFTSRKTTICLDCLDREALDLLGRPRRRGGWASAFACENCNGNGRVSIPDRERRDPYDTKKGLT